VYTVQDGGPVPVHELEIIALTEASAKDKFNAPPINKWWTGDKDALMSAIYHAQRQLPPTNKADYEKNWKSIVNQLQKKYPAPTAIFKKRLNEATDINDPVLVAIRAMKTQMKKKTPVKKIKKVSFDQYLKLIGIQEDLVEDMKDTAEDIQDLFRNMEQEAEPSGGPVADKYGAELDKLEKQYATLKKKKAVVDKKIENYRMS
jgi:hypothetical protein